MPRVVASRLRREHRVGVRDAQRPARAAAEERVEPLERCVRDLDVAVAVGGAPHRREQPRACAAGAPPAGAAAHGAPDPPAARWRS